MAGGAGQVGPGTIVADGSTITPSTVLFGDGACGTTPSMAFKSQPTLGWYRVATDQIALCSSTTPKFLFYSGGAVVASGASFQWVSSINAATGTVDTGISRVSPAVIQVGN